MRILGLDYGRKRVGVALSDALGITAQPEGSFLQDNQIWSRIEELIHKHKVEEIVLGYPRLLNGSPGSMAKEVEDFGKKLEEKTKLPVHFWDERLSTSESEKLLIQADVRRNRRKEIRDTMAATLILQGYLEAHSQ